MRILASMIRGIKTGNIAIVTLAGTAIITVAAWVILFGGSEEAIAQEAGGTQAHPAGGTEVQTPKSYMGLGLLAAAISTCVSAIAAGVAVSIVGSAALGAVAEQPELMGRSIIFVGLAEGIAIYGLIISIMILGKL
jgi:F0F1-type ATP synthase membrane subunit c/vacuolar-type H+-ATPase subunit K